MPDSPQEIDRKARVHFMLGHEHGRAFIWEMLAHCQVFGASFTGDAQTTAFREGRRDIGIRILAEIDDFDPNALTRMKVEAKDRQQRYHVSTLLAQQQRDDET